jgi:hypothetical protein
VPRGFTTPEPDSRFDAQGATANIASWHITSIRARGHDRRVTAPPYEPSEVAAREAQCKLVVCRSFAGCDAQRAAASWRHSETIVPIFIGRGAPSSLCCYAEK